MVAQRDVFVPGRHDGQPRGPAANGDLSLPLVEKPFDEGESLAPSRIAEAAHALNQRRFERRSVSPALAEALGMGALEGTAEADPSIADRDDDDPAAQPAPEGIGLNRHPATGAGVLHNILARLRKRHTEAQRGLHFEAQLAVKNAGGALGDLVHHSVHVLRGAHRGHIEQHVGGTGGAAPGHLAVQLEQLGGLSEESGPSPVALHLVAGRAR